MSLLELASLGLALGTDSFSVSVGIGMNRLRLSTIIKLTLLFSLMQVVLFAGGTYFHCVLDYGLYIASRLVNNQSLAASVQEIASWLHMVFSLVGAALLFGLGINMLRSVFGRQSEEKPVYYSGRLGLLMLAFSVSVDALTAGVGVGMFSEVNIWLGSVVLGVVIALMAAFGLSLGQQISRYVGKNAEVVGGIILIGLAFHFLLSCSAFW